MQLPVSAEMYFDDFSFAIMEYNVIAQDSVVATYRGLPNSDEDGDCISFLMSDHPQIAVGYTICTSDGLKSFNITRIAYGYYDGRPELLNAYY